MKKLLNLIVMLLLALGANAQFKYLSNGQLTFGNITPPYGYATAWEGKGHYFHYSGSTSGNAWLKFYLGTNGPRISANTSYIRFYDTDTEVYHDLYVSSVYETSDLRLKTNISNVQSPLIKTLQLRPVQYTLLKSHSDKSTSQDIGFIAQELEKIIPEAVTTDDSGNKLINYRTLIAILTGAIQEMSIQINDLTELVKVLQAQINNAK